MLVITNPCQISDPCQASDCAGQYRPVKYLTSVRSWELEGSWDLPASCQVFDRSWELGREGNWELATGRPAGCQVFGSWVGRWVEVDFRRVKYLTGRGSWVMSNLVTKLPKKSNNRFQKQSRPKSNVSKFFWNNHSQTPSFVAGKSTTEVNFATKKKERSWGTFTYASAPLNPTTLYYFICALPCCRVSNKISSLHSFITCCQLESYRSNFRSYTGCCYNNIFSSSLLCHT